MLHMNERMNERTDERKRMTRQVYFCGWQRTLNFNQHTATSSITHRFSSNSSCIDLIPFHRPSSSGRMGGEVTQQMWLLHHTIYICNKGVARNKIGLDFRISIDFWSIFMHSLVFFIIGTDSI